LLERHCFLAAHLALSTRRQPGPLTDVNRNPAAQIGQAEGGSAIAAVRRAEQRIEGLILGYLQQPAIAIRPTFWGVGKANHPDFTDEWFTHDIPPVVRIESEKLCRDLKQVVRSDLNSGITSFANC